LNADADTAPLQVIQGPKTQMDWPEALNVDPFWKCRRFHPDKIRSFLSPVRGRRYQSPVAGTEWSFNR